MLHLNPSGITARNHVYRKPLGNHENFWLTYVFLAVKLSQNESVTRS